MFAFLYTTSALVRKQSKGKTPCPVAPIPTFFVNAIGQPVGVSFFIFDIFEKRMMKRCSEWQFLVSTSN